MTGLASPAQFSIRDAVGLIDILFFQFGLAVSFVVYLVWLFATYSEFALVILGMTSTVYIAVGLISFLLANAACGRHGSLALFPYALLYVSGVIAKLSPDSVKVRTPVATVAVRGTRFLADVKGD